MSTLGRGWGGGLFPVGLRRCTHRTQGLRAVFKAAAPFLWPPAEARGVPASAGGPSPPAPPACRGAVAPWLTPARVLAYPGTLKVRSPPRVPDVRGLRLGEAVGKSAPGGTPSARPTECGAVTAWTPAQGQAHQLPSSARGRSPVPRDGGYGGDSGWAVRWESSLLLLVSSRGNGGTQLWNQSA